MLRDVLFLIVGIVGLKLYITGVLDTFYLPLFTSVTLIASVYVAELATRINNKRNRSNVT